MKKKNIMIEFKDLTVCTVARTLKQMFRMCLRTTAMKSKSASDVPFKNCSPNFSILFVLKRIVILDETLPSQVFKRFDHVRCDLKNAGLRNQFSLNRLIHRLTRDCGITLDLERDRSFLSLREATLKV